MTKDYCIFSETLASSHSILSDPMHFTISNLFKWSTMHTMSNTTPPQTLRIGSWIWETWENSLLVKTNAKKVWNTTAVSVSWVTRFPSPLSSRATFSSCILCSCFWQTYRSPFCFHSHPFIFFNFSWAFTFLTVGTMILYASRRIVEVVMNLYILPTNSTRWITAKKYKTTSGFQTFFFFFMEKTLDIKSWIN